MFQINEEDLATLERELPAICERVYPQLDNALRVKFRQVQRIVTDVRWNYGPPAEVREIPAEGDERAD